MSKPQVLITDLITDDLEIEQGILGDVAEVSSCDAQHERDLQGRVEQAAALMVYHCISISAATVDRLNACKLIIRCGVGTDNVDIAAATAQGIPVANVPDYGTEEVADTAIGMLLTLTRGIHQLNALLQARQREWSYHHVVPLSRLRGEVFGVVGLGRIGTAAALRAKALGMDVVFYDPYKPDGYDKALGIRRVHDFATLLAESYVVSFHCPLTHETRHMMNSASILKMRHGSFLINTSRGQVVDTTVIPEAIQSGRLAGAGIDVLHQEPPDDNLPLLAAWRDATHPAYHRVIINPHSAFYSEAGLAEIRTKASHACRAALLGEEIRTRVN